MMDNDGQADLHRQATFPRVSVKILPIWASPLFWLVVLCGLVVVLKDGVVEEGKAKKGATRGGYWGTSIGVSCA